MVQSPLWLLSRSTISPYFENCMYVVLIVHGTNYMPSFGRLLPSGTELIPLFPYLRTGLLKGGQRRYTPWQPGTGIRP